MSPWSTAELVLDERPASRARRPPSSWTPTTSTSSVSSGRAALAGTAGWPRRPTPSDGSSSVYRRADRVVCVTDADAAVVRTEIPDADIVVVPTPTPRSTPAPGSTSAPGCLFVGNFNHQPNGDAVLWWSQEIGPAPGRSAFPTPTSPWWATIRWGAAAELGRSRDHRGRHGGVDPAVSSTRPGCRWRPCATAPG